MPMIPSSNRASMSGRPILACSSISRTSGRMRLSENSRTLCRSSCSSSARRVRDPRASTTDGVMERMLSSGLERDVETRASEWMPGGQTGRPWAAFARAAAVAAVVCAATALTLGAQTAPQNPPQNPRQTPPPGQQPTFRVRIDSVSVDVTRHRQAGQSRHRSHRRRLRDQGSRQDPEDRHVQARRDRRQPRRPRRRARSCRSRISAARPAARTTGSS